MLYPALTLLIEISVPMAYFLAGVGIFSLAFMRMRRLGAA